MEKLENVSKTHEIDVNKLSSKEIFIYILGNIPQTILSGIFLLVYIKFFSIKLKLQMKYFIIGQIGYMILNACNVFFLGRLSETTNVEKWGSRCLIYIRWGEMREKKKEAYKS
jgi:hypothetical protein